MYAQGVKNRNENSSFLNKYCRIVSFPFYLSEASLKKLLYCCAVTYSTDILNVFIINFVLLAVKIITRKSFWMEAQRADNLKFNTT